MVMDTTEDAYTDTLRLDSQAAWAQWLAANLEHDGVWLLHAKKDSGVTTVTYQEALEVALCFGWIDGQRKAVDAQFFKQRWTPRRARSIWSKVNRDKALAYIADGRMQPSGLAQVERARADGRWDAAYGGFGTAEVPPDLQAAFALYPGSAAFFATLNAQNRYALLFRIHGAKKAETRARRIAEFAAMLARGETIHPLRPGAKTKAPA